ncbi:MAG: alpha/beta hydrolase fold domain-containing protein [bacterium]
MKKIKVLLIFSLVFFMGASQGSTAEAKLFNFFKKLKSADQQNFSAAQPSSPVKSELIAPPGNGELSEAGDTYTMVQESIYKKGTEYEYWIFEPEDADLNKKLPLIIFNHGWNGKKPFFYQGWINHLAKRGNIVIFPRLQKKAWNLTASYTPNAIESVKMALEKLNTVKKHHRPDIEKVATIGHSVGGIISANLAAIADSAGIPRPRAVMCVEPGATWINTKMEDLSKIPEDTLLLTVAGDKDTVAFDIDAKKIVEEAINIPKDYKNFVSIPAADHLAPCGAKNNDSDIYGFWKLFDDLCDEAFYGTTRKYGGIDARFPFSQR